ncbi:hypothetical protein [Nocardioides sp.]|uniref:hypothetical protein n=1 Tax=Nocardioides sp. TaxID=35761 RepID=UPI002BE27F9B|nr:hypothetical protein [Nocardioides sp.]HSX68039.1 hypothetical protein [Nocardioides sp.]
MAVVAAVLLLAGCGGEAPTSAADQVPALGARLEKVDSLMAARAWAKARAELRAIVAAANAARASGDLDATDADRVVASAQRLLAALPAPVTPSATPTPTRTAPSGTPSSRDTDKGAGGGKGDNKGNNKGNGKKN